STAVAAPAALAPLSESRSSASRWAVPPLQAARSSAAAPSTTPLRPTPLRPPVGPSRSVIVTPLHLEYQRPNFVYGTKSVMIGQEPLARKVHCFAAAVRWRRRSSSRLGSWLHHAVGAAAGHHPARGDEHVQAPSALRTESGRLQVSAATLPTVGSAAARAVGRLGHSTPVRLATGMRRSASIRRSSWGERPSVVR